MESPSTIEKASPELKSTSNSSRGLWAEEVAKASFLQEKFQFLYQRKKLKFGEVDLIFSKSKVIYFIEVKMLHNPWMSFERLGHKQKQRIIKNSIFYQKLNPKYMVICLLCFVHPNKKIDTINLTEN